MKNKVKNLLKPMIGMIITLLSPFWLQFFKFIAKTGIGTDICLKNGFLPMRVHFYSPVPDLDDLRTRHVWEKRSELTGLDFRKDRQIQLLRKLGGKFGEECNWPAKPTDDPYAFYSENNSFSFGCAASLYSIIRYYKPRRIIEIGSGNSSRVFSSAVERNLSESKLCNYYIVDPYPSEKIEKHLPGLSRLIKERVELQPPDLFDSLSTNDILFIDSGHTVRTGGDVNFLYLDILPRLAPGVMVHIHDIPMPLEYPEVYFTKPTFRVFWTESYLLQAFMCFNNQFEILLAMNYLMTERLDEFRKAFPHYDPEVHKAVSGSFWIRRIKRR
jgi:hypothetical protein